MSIQKRNDIKRCIYIDIKDSRTSFLSNDSIYPFELDNKIWPSVTHYVEAKKFEGTQLEEQIRAAPTIFEIKKLTRGRPKYMNDDYKIVYGKKLDDVYDYRRDIDIKAILEKSIKAKLSSYPFLTKKLLDLKNTNIIDPSNEHTGTILENIRDKKEVVKVPSDKTTDIDTPDLSTDELTVVKKIISMAIKIKKIEQQKHIYPEMIEDVLYNIIPADYNEVINFIEETPWNVIYRDMPTFERLVMTINKLFSKKDKEQKKQIKNSAYIGSFIKYCRSRKSIESIKKFLEKDIDLKLVPTARWYRNSAPKKIKREMKIYIPFEQYKDEYERCAVLIEVFKSLKIDVDDYSKIIDILESQSIKKSWKWINRLKGKKIENVQTFINKLFNKNREKF
jgi:predicted NAD-dependent protein-ADP-ribosyltransferase YbiA (DUF1768 family)